MKLADNAEVDHPKGRTLVPYDTVRAWTKVLFGAAVPSVRDIAGAAELLKQVKRIRHALQDIEDALAAHIDSLWPNALGEENKQVDIEGVGRVSRHRGRGRKEWDREGLTRVVAAKAADERRVGDDGEPLESEGACMARVLGECFRFEARMTPLKKRGIDVDEFSVATDGKLSVDVFDNDS